MQVRIETFDEIQVARMRHVGPYDQAGPCFDKLIGWALATGSPIGRVLTLSWDDPDTVAREELRSDVCVEIRTEAPPPEGACIDRVGAGRHAVHTLEGPYDRIPGTYRRLFGQWLPESGEEIDERPCMEIYRNSPRDTEAARLLTDLCLPLRARVEG